MRGYQTSDSITVQKKPSRLLSQLIRSIGNSVRYLSKEGRVCIITYHRILEHRDPLLETEPDVDTFTWQMETLAACFNVLSLPEAINAIKENRVPPRAVCISFDDGYRSCHDLALPIINRLDLHATVFVTTGYLDGGNMWNDRIIEAIRRLPEGPLDLREVGLGLHAISGQEERKAIVHKISDDSKYLPADTRIQVIKKLEKLAGFVQDSHLMLTREMIANLSEQGMEIGGHTITHPILANLNDNDARYEIVENKRVLEKIVGKPITLFAYPNGKVEADFEERHVTMVKEAGYTAAFTTAFGVATSANDFFQIPRSRPWDLTPFIFSMRLLFWLAISFGKKK
ncbi:MAG: polysaccharide deacetylase family protein [Pseudomonadota bacterium]